MSDNANEGTGGFLHVSRIKTETNNPFGSGFTYYSHGTRVVSVSPDGKWVAFGGWDEIIQVCELIEDGRRLTYRGHKDYICAIEWSPDGTYIASASRGEAAADVQVWEATTGQTITRIQNDEEKVRSLAWSPDSVHLAFSTERSTIHLVKALTGEIEFVYQEHTVATWISTVAWSPDGTRIASSGLDGTVQVWNVSDGSNICRYLGHFGAVNAVAWSPDGMSIASGGDDKTVQVWNASTREPICTYQHHNDRVMVVGWSLDGQRIRSASWDNTIRDFDAYSGVYVSSFTFPSILGTNAMPFAWNPRATTFAVGLDDRRVASIDTITGKFWICRAPTISAEVVGQMQASLRQPMRQGRSVKLWGSVEREVVTYGGHASAVKAISWSPDNLLIASGGYDNTIQIWDATDGTLHATCRGHRDPITAVAWSPDGQRLVSGSLDMTARIWDALTGQCITDYHGHSAAISSLAWSSNPSSSNATHIVSGSVDGTIQIWDTEKKVSHIYRGHHGIVNTVASSSNGCFIASGGEDKTVQVWDAVTGELVYMYRGHTTGVLSVAWSLDGKRIVSSGERGRIVENDGTSRRDDIPKVHLWDALTGSNPIFCNEDFHHAGIQTVAWSPDSRFVAAGTIFDRIHIYDATTGEEFAQVSSHVRGRNQRSGSVLALTWSPDGQHLAASFSSGLVYVWPAR